MHIKYIFYGILISFLINISLSDDSKYEDHAISKVTYGSIVKLGHQTTKFRLHSHKVSYGNTNGGSGQQSVTGFPDLDDTNSLWIIKAENGKHIPQGTVVKNGDIIRLTHLNTKKNLHSHLAVSPLTKQHEVSCFGDNGEGDTGDNWKIEFSDGDILMRGKTFKLLHVDTKSYLHGSPNAKYQNPIPGQMEIAGSTRKSADNDWQTEEGIYFEERDPKDLQ
eukprot:gene2720-3377_t